MAKVFWVILADLILAAVFIYRFRQEMGLTAIGWNDNPAVQKKSPYPVVPELPPPGPTDPAGGAADRRRPGTRM
jgi:hypothetical protein